jgi:predicted metal-binding membrane protein
MVLRRDRAIVLAALLTLTALAWAYLLLLFTEMPIPMQTMEGMAGMAMDGMAMDAAAPVSNLLFAFAMWAVMMIGMMTPSVAPMILLYAKVGRRARSDSKPFASAVWFVAGYLAAWIGFALAASVAQEALQAAALLTSALASASGIFGGVLLIVAGVYQWSPLKNSCLGQCRAPIQFVQQHGGFRSDPMGALTLGLKHGAYCIGCCWALMTLLFIGGVMNLLWVAGLSILVLLEKVAPAGRHLTRAIGLALVAAGSILLVRNVEM